MAKLNILNPRSLASLGDGIHKDGGGLQLANQGESSIWEFRFTSPTGGRAKMKVADRAEMSLKDARDRRDMFAELLRDGKDPRHVKRPVKDGKTFKACADEVWPSMAAGNGPEEAAQWERAVRELEVLWDRHPQSITNQDALAVLKPIWTERPVKGKRLRQRIERIFGAFKATGIYKGDNPFGWRDNLKHLLPAPDRLHKKMKAEAGTPKGHPSLPYMMLPAMLHQTRHERSPVIADLVQWAVLTCTRSQEARLTEWKHIDLVKRIWTIPAKVMKMKEDHYVPLSDQAIEVLQRQKKTGRYVFASDDIAVVGQDKPFLPNALTNCINRNTDVHATMHGMRTTFRNWAADFQKGNFRKEVVEFCLAHREGNETELSYWDSHMVERRRDVMQAWGNFCKPPKKKDDTKRRDNVVSMQRSAAA